MIAAALAVDGRLVQIGLQGKRVSLDDTPPSNLVFLLDVSGSMNSPDKLPLLKEGLWMLVGQLKPEDRVAIAVYAGSSGLVLPSTPASNKGEILAALDFRDDFDAFVEFERRRDPAAHDEVVIHDQDCYCA